MLVKKIGRSMDKLEFHCVVAFGTAGEDLVREQRNLMRKTVALVNDPVNAAF
jgi:hypothetical protein